MRGLHIKQVTGTPVLDTDCTWINQYSTVHRIRSIAEELHYSTTTVATAVVFNARAADQCRYYMLRHGANDLEPLIWSSSGPREAFMGEGVDINHPLLSVSFDVRVPPPHPFQERRT